jgi:membrane fusion protein, heavy metal efflux system
MRSTDHAANAWGRSFLWGGIVLGLLLLAALLSGGFGLLRGAKTSQSEAPLIVRRGEQIIVPASSPLRSRLEVRAARRADTINAKQVLPGIVESDPARTAAVLTPLGGRVLEINAALGDHVHKGQVLAVIDSPDLAQAYADDGRAEDTLQLTKKNLARQQEQLELGTASARDLDQARSDYAQAEAEYARTQSRLKVIGVATGGRRSSQLRVEAPVDGSVTTVTIARGNMINDPTQPIMTVADLSTVWVTALVPEKDVGAVTKGQDAEVQLDAYPGRTLRGKVLFISDVIEPDSRRDKLRIAFPNPDTALKPNMFATVTLSGSKQTRVLLPTSALLMNNDRTTVFIATAPWTFERRTVEPELDEGTTVALDSGVQAGEQVVVKGGILLND